jgi:hypothetical protein
MRKRLRLNPRLRVALGLLCVSGVNYLASGCARSHLAVRPAGFSPQGRWRSKQTGMVMTAHLQPDGTLEMVDPHGGRHPFRRVAPERWQARISRTAQATIRREGDQLVFRREPTPESLQPVRRKNGLMIVTTFKPSEDPMTRVPEGR